MRTLLLLSVVGLVACMFFHVAGWTSVDAQDQYPYFWAPAIGIFVVWIPLVRLQNKLSAAQGTRPDSKVLRTHAPAWMHTLSQGLMIYGVIWFFALIPLRGCDGNAARAPDGTYSVYGRRQTIAGKPAGRIRIPISEARYHQMRNAEVQMLTAWVAMFYGVAVTGYVSELIRRREERERGSTSVVR